MRRGALSRFRVVTVTNSIFPTNMPYNDFVLYRYYEKQQHDQRMIMILREDINTQVEYPEDLIIYRCGKRIKKIRNSAAKIIKDYEKGGKKVIFHIHEPKSVILFHFATRGKYRKQIVYTVHSTFSNYALKTKIICIISSLLSQRIVCVSQTSYKHYPVILKKLLKGKVFCIQNGVYSERVDRTLNLLQTKSNLVDCSCLRLVYVARLVTLKRHDILLNALRNLPNCEITFIGAGNQREQLKALSKEYEIGDRVHFAGVIPRDEVYSQIKQHDVYVSSSSYEGLPISVLEAMSCGVVCAVSDIEQHREIQEKCPSLITVKNTVEDWVKAIEKIAAMSAEERTKIGKQNKKDVDQYFSLARMHAQYDRVYDEVARGITK